MAKAILVMDMPTVCDECDLMGVDNETDEPVCCAVNGMVQRYEKPEWCPIKSLDKISEKIEARHPYRIQGEPETYSQYNEGWEDAIYAMCTEIIEGGRHE